MFPALGSAGKFKFSLQTGVGRCTLMNEPAWFRIQAERGGTALRASEWGLPFFTETALATGSTSVTAVRMEDRKTLRRHEVARVRQVVGMNLTAEWSRIQVGRVTDALHACPAHGMKGGQSRLRTHTSGDDGVDPWRAGRLAYARIVRYQMRLIAAFKNTHIRRCLNRTN